MIKLRKGFSKGAQWINNNSALNAFENAYGLINIFVIIGAFGNLIGKLLTNYLKVRKLGLFFTMIGNFSFDHLSLIMLILISWFYAETIDKKAKNDVKKAVIISVCIFIEFVPNGINIFNIYDFYEGLLFSILVVNLYFQIKKQKIKKIKIKNIPSNNFHMLYDLLPVFMLCSIFAFFKILVGNNFSNTFYIVINIITKIVSSLPVILMVIMMQQLLWFWGLHGFGIIWKIIGWLWLPLFYENIYKFSTTLSFKDISIAPNTIANTYAMIGGSGSTIGLVIALLIICRKGSLGKKIGKEALKSSLFAVNEPLIFGFPIVMNRIMLMPWLVAPIVNAIISYVVTGLGWVVPITFINIGGEPILVSTWILGGFRLSPVILTIVLILLDVLIYIPFVVYSKKKGRI